MPHSLISGSSLQLFTIHLANTEDLRLLESNLLDFWSGILEKDLQKESTEEAELDVLEDESKPYLDFDFVLLCYFFCILTSFSSFVSWGGILNLA